MTLAETFRRMGNRTLIFNQRGEVEARDCAAPNLLLSDAESRQHPSKRLVDDAALERLRRALMKEAAANAQALDRANWFQIEAACKRAISRGAIADRLFLTKPELHDLVGRVTAKGFGRQVEAVTGAPLSASHGVSNDEANLLVRDAERRAARH